jgi:glycosyltransferase involved in cell wall biosynthesis
MSNELRFCMITTFYPPYNFGGDGIFVQHLSNELARRGHTVDIIHCVDTYQLSAPLPQQDYADHPNVTVHGLRSRHGMLSPLATHQTGLPLLKSKRIREILTKGFDVIHYHNISLVGGPGILALGKAIKLYTMHDYWLVCPTHSLFRFNRAPCPRPSLCLACTLVYKRPPQLWRYFGLMERSVRHIDAFIAPSLTSQRKHEQLGIKGRIVHLANFVSINETHGADTEQTTSDSSGPRYFLFVGRLERPKGLHTLIPAFERQANAELWIAGSGSEEPALREAARGNPNIRFLGHLSSDRLKPLYRNAVALIYPSVNFQVGPPQPAVTSGQGAPLVIIEAFSQKTPVIASHFGRIPALLEQSGGGVVYSSEQELAEVMNRFLNDSAYRNNFGLRGHEAYRKKWTADAHLQGYLALIEEIASKKYGEHHRAIRAKPQ